MVKAWRFPQRIFHYRAHFLTELIYVLNPCKKTYCTYARPVASESGLGYVLEVNLMGSAWRHYGHKTRRRKW